MSNVFEHLDIEYEELNKLGIVDITMVKGERGSSGDYEQLSHLPKINGVTVTGNKTSNDLLLASQASMQSAESRLTVVENKIETIADPTDEQVAQAVDAWLDEHPEATTTVEDGAVTFPKLASDVTDLFINETATAGDIVSFDDGARNIPVKNLTIDIAATQDLHGYDHPWVGGARKNKFDKSTVTLGKLLTNTGAEHTSSNGSYSGYIPIITNTPYYFSHIEGIGSFYSMCVYDADKTFLENINIQGSSDASGSVTFTQGAYIRVNVHQSNLGTCQIELGSTATAYEPYENICPINGWDEVNVTRTGKNLLGGTALRDNINNALANGVTIDDTNKTINFLASATKIANKSFSDGVKFKENTRYTFIFKGNTSDSSAPTGNMLVRYTDRTYEFLSGFTTSLKTVVLQLHRERQYLK